MSFETVPPPEPSPRQRSAQGVSPQQANISPGQRHGGHDTSAPAPLLRGLESLIPIAKELHHRGLSSAEIKAALKKALELHRARGKASR